MTLITSVIVGHGEVGSALHEIIGGDVHDPAQNKIISGHYDLLNICIPYNDKFIQAVKEYQVLFSPLLTVIHSTVPLGTSQACNAVHSPIRGVHPHLAKGIRTFVKFFGGPDAQIAAEYFNKYGIETEVTDKSETTEAMKLWDTTQYGLLILMERQIHAWCDKNGVDFNVVYTTANRTYNEGYRALARDEVVRPYLCHTEGKIGGHCVRQNAHLLDASVAKLLEDSN
jgi:UDP-N-acetyl-D-mannosaminuronate dehydrogenase